MKTRPKRTVFAVAGLVSALALVILVAQAQSVPAQSVPAGRKMAEEVYKNIQVFKGVPADQVIPAMQFISDRKSTRLNSSHSSPSRMPSSA